jgi:hypothetical protein
MEKLLNELVRRLTECIALSLPSDKIEQVHTLIERHKVELYQQIASSSDAEVIKSKFSNFINKTLSTIEVVELEDSRYKALRKLALSEIHGCLDTILTQLKKNEEQPVS